MIKKFGTHISLMRICQAHYCIVMECGMIRPIQVSKSWKQYAKLAVIYLIRCKAISPVKKTIIFSINVEYIDDEGMSRKRCKFLTFTYSMSCVTWMLTGSEYHYGFKMFFKNDIVITRSVKMGSSTLWMKLGNCLKILSLKNLNHGSKLSNSISTK